MTTDDPPADDLEPPPSRPGAEPVDSPEPIHVIGPPESMRRVRIAAGLVGRAVGDFALEAAESRAEEVLVLAGETVVEPRTFADLRALATSAPKPEQALLELAGRPHPIVRR